MWASLLAGITLIDKIIRSKTNSFQGMTLIELIIVMTVIGILMATAMPSYRNYILRVNRSEAIRMLLQASMCQERISASRGSYDTNLCQPVSEQQRYLLTYHSPDTQGQTYVVTATPRGAQLADPCGSLSLNQNGARSISAMGISVIKCWNGR
jgi:type IV pilus assembly protein PilE